MIVSASRTRHPTAGPIRLRLPRPRWISRLQTRSRPMRESGHCGATTRLCGPAPEWSPKIGRAPDSQWRPAVPMDSPRLPMVPDPSGLDLQGAGPHDHRAESTSHWDLAARSFHRPAGGTLPTPRMLKPYIKLHMARRGSFQTVNFLPIDLTQMRDQSKKYQMVSRNPSKVWSKCYLSTQIRGQCCLVRKLHHR